MFPVKFSIHALISGVPSIIRILLITVSVSDADQGADYTNGLIGQIETGSTKPSFDRIINIANALGIHPADLFFT